MSTPAPTRVGGTELRGDIVPALVSVDHKTIARRLLWATLFFFIGGGVMALLMRLELAQPGLQIVSTKGYNALFTMHGSTMIYLVIIPLALALGVYMVPLQVGAPELAWPRVALFGLVTFVLGGVVLEAGWLSAGGPGQATWIGVAPLSELARTPSSGQDLWVLGVLLATLGELCLGSCVLATALRRRAPGMTLLRMPPFTWTMVATCLLVVVSMPVLVVLMALLWIDRRTGGIFSDGNGPLAYQHLFWFYGHPVVYVMFFPFVGAVAEIFATFAGRRFFGYKIFVFSILLFAALSMSVWGHHMFTTGRIDDRYFALTTHAILVAAGIEYFDDLATLWRGSIRFTTAFLFACAFLVQFLVGGLTGIWVGSPPLDFQANNSYFVVAHFHYTLFAGSMFGAFAAIYYWFPKWSGRLLREGLGKLHFGVLVVGANLTFAPQFALGQEGMTRRIADYPASTGWGSLNLLSTIGAYITALGVLIFVVNVWVSLRRPVWAGDDPWEGHSLEWATTSPPPRHNFAALPAVRSYAPLWDLRHPDAEPIS